MTEWVGNVLTVLQFSSSTSLGRPPSCSQTVLSAEHQPRYHCNTYVHTGL